MNKKGKEKATGEQANIREKIKDFQVPTNELNEIKKVVGVVSGKGGVGKSLVTALLAVRMRQKGYAVGILDADITGPSIPKMFGLREKALASDQGIFPEMSRSKIRIMSINLLLEQDDSPVILRGPMVSGVVKQFWTDVIWGKLDFLFVDMPPGTGDVSLTVYQSLPLDGIIIVTSPQELVNLIVKKAYNMAKSMGVPVLGMVENMSYFKCPDCHEKINLFGDSRLEEIAGELGIPVLGRIPIDPDLAVFSDRGELEDLEKAYLEGAAAVLAAEMSTKAGGNK